MARVAVVQHVGRVVAGRRSAGAVAMAGRRSLVMTARQQTGGSWGRTTAAATGIALGIAAGVQWAQGARGGGGVMNDSALEGAQTISGKVAESEKEESAFNPDTGEINWDCPCLGGMAHGPCGEEFKKAFSCFVYSQEEQKGIDCIEQFKGMQECFRAHPEVYGDQLDEDEEDAPQEDKSDQVVRGSGLGGSEGNRRKQSDAKAKFENEGKAKTRGGPHIDSTAAKAGAHTQLNTAKHTGDIDVHEEHDAGGNPHIRKMPGHNERTA